MSMQIVVVLLVLTSTILGQTSMSSVKSDSLTAAPNVPDEVRLCAETAKAQIRYDVNPFYIAADFDGDGQTDFAVNVNKSGNLSKPGISHVLYCFANGKTSVWSAGGSEAAPAITNWLLIPRRSKHLAPYKNMRTDVLALSFSEKKVGYCSIGMEPIYSRRPKNS